MSKERREKKKVPPKIIPLGEIVGKTIKSYKFGTTDGAWGKEPVIWLQFTDNTRHGFVLPPNE